MYRFSKCAKKCFQLGLAAITVMTAGSVARAQTIYAIKYGYYTHTYSFGTFDVASGVFNQMSVMPETINALAFGGNGTLYAAGAHDLYTINGTDGSFHQLPAYLTTTTVGLAAGSSANQLLGVDVYGQLMTIDVTTGGQSLYGDRNSQFPYGARPGSLAYGPGGTLYYIDQYGLYSRDPFTGSSTAITGEIGSPYAELDSLVYAGGHLDIFQNRGGGQTVNDYANGGVIDGYYSNGAAEIWAAASYGGYGSGPSPVTPEPGSIALLTAIGLSGVGIARRRRHISRATRSN